jgi:hypothetical protein
VTRIRVTAPIGAPGSVWVDDTPLNVPLRAVSFEAVSGASPVLYLQTLGDVLLDVEGVVIQWLPLPGDELLDTLEQFLAGLDPESLEADALAVLSSQGLGEMTTGQAFVTALRARAGAADART